MVRLAPLALAALLAGCSTPVEAGEPPVAKKGQEIAVFAGGCFWCMEKPFDAVDGVLDTTSGYTGGSVENPTYKQVSAGSTGHAEVIQVTFDPKKVSYEALLDVFWVNIDPLDAKGQFCDKGTQYRSGIFPIGEAQTKAAAESLAKITARFDQPVATRIEPAATFYPAEDYHQDYYKTHPYRYTYYRGACGRDARLSEVWGDAAGH